jgi:hypothetical protein
MGERREKTTETHRSKAVSGRSQETSEDKDALGQVLEALAEQVDHELAHVGLIVRERRARRQVLSNTQQRSR